MPYSKSPPQYQAAGITCIPRLVDPSSAFQYCNYNVPTYNGGDTIADLNAPDSPLYDLNVWDTQGNGIGTESYEAEPYEAESDGPKSLQDKVHEKLYKSPLNPYITFNNAPPSAINLSKVINDHDNYVFQNKQLAGGEAARAKIPPIITPPIVSEEYWKINDFMVPTGINSETNVDLTRSGYLQNGCYNGTEVMEPYVPEDQKSITRISIMSDQYTNNNEVVPSIQSAQPVPQQHGTLIDNIEHYKSNKPNKPNKPNEDDINERLPKNMANDHTTEGHVPNGFINTTNLQQQPPNPKIPCENCCQGASCKPDCVKSQVTVGKIQDEMINMPYGYNANQLEASNIPSNLPTGPVNKDPAFNCYNKDIFTTNIQPGVFSRTEIVEPLNSNIGISFAQQFEPIDCEKDCNGGVTFVQKDSRIIPVHQKVEVTKNGPDESNVYDPRFTGYGTNYRSYIDNVTGQPRFYYDDVMVHRQNNYLTRNKIDFTSFGPQINDINQKYGNMSIRHMAQDAFVDNTIQYRTELQSRLLRKANVDSWQQKVAPLSKGTSCNC